MDKDLEVTIDVSKAEADLDRLLAKARELKGLIGEINAGVAPKSEVPQLVYAVNMGDIMQFATAPAQFFTPEFLERTAADLKQILKPMPKKQAPEAPVKKSKLIIPAGQA